MTATKNILKVKRNEYFDRHKKLLRRQRNIYSGDSKTTGKEYL